MIALGREEAAGESGPPVVRPVASPDVADALWRFVTPWLTERPLLAVDRPLPREAIDELCREPRIAGVVLRAPDQSPEALEAGRRGHFHDPPYDWSLPAQRSALLAFWGPRRRITAAMLRSAQRAGVRRIVYASPDGARVESTVRMLAARATEAARQEAIRRIPALAPWIGHSTLRRLRRWLPAETRPHAVSSQPRVVLVNHSLSMGGTERQLVTAAAALRRRGIADVLVACERRRDYAAGDPFGAALEAVAIPIIELPDTIDPALVAQLPPTRRQDRRLPDILADDALFYASLWHTLKPDVVHTWQDGSNVKAGLGAILAGVPRVVLSARNMPPHQFGHVTSWMWPGYRALLERENVAMLANSHAGAAAYGAWLGLPPARIRTVPNAVQVEHWASRDDAAATGFRARHRLERAPVVGSVFRFYPEKDPLLWLRACAAIAACREDLRFLLVGEGPMRPRLEAEAARLGLADRLRLVGELDDPLPAYAVMDVLLLASASEGLPNVLLEAQAAGVPVVAARTGGMEEAFDPGRTGLLVTRHTPEALAAAVLRVLSDSAWAEAARAAGPRFVAARFGVERMVDQLLAAYGVESAGRS